MLTVATAARENGSSLAASLRKAVACSAAIRRCFSLANRGEATGNDLSLDDILSVAELNDVEWVRSAKVRTAEALFLERMWKVTRELLPPTAFVE